MKMKTAVCAGLVFLLLNSSSMLSAQYVEKVRRHVFSIFPVVGTGSNFFFGQLLPLAGTADVPEITVQSKSKGLEWGFALGCQISDRIGFQGLFSFGRAEFQEDQGIGFAGIPLGIFKLADVKSYSYSGNISYSIPVKRISFSITGGAGAIRVNPTGLKTKTGLLLNFGGGVAMNPMNHLRLFLDLRNFMSFFDFAEDFGVIYDSFYEQVFKRTQHRLFILLGLGYLF